MTTAPPAPSFALESACALAARHARAAEESACLHPDVVAALPETGFARHFVPRRWGGAAGDFADAVHAVATVGESCASTAWCCALLAAHARLAAHLPEEAQAELWARSPDTAIAAAVVPPSGRLTRVSGGWLLTGRWSFASGVEHADWILLAVLDEGPVGPPGHRILLLPRRDVRVNRTWDSVGLSATGSHEVEVEGAFVPEHRSCLRDVLMAGVGGPDAAPCHQVPYPLVAALLFCAPALGAARAALDAWVALAGARGGAADPAVRQTLAACSGDIDAAALLLEAAAQRADRAARVPRAAFAPEEAARNQRDASRAAALSADAVSRLFRSAGARALMRSNPLQRAWRDVHAVAAHATLQPGVAAASYARTVFAQVGA
ncbi:hypothetical protein GTW43_19110 [Streptomyces sp. SID5785]|uniref:acyl-CoA dehydrogenase family protein n=1 Tax=Streptomyces sp. SID5785 TaxID=2690309 RepID=UPI0013614AD3|nr:acyl-CoA dehydrogenase family protein [Streptomyces sp. SID5785]MZD07179.1 hypothetical protein [Streptomyces sp. SID5785]